MTNPSLFTAALRLLQTWDASAESLGPEWVGMSERIDALKVAVIHACPEPYWHETHRYCPRCPWTEDSGV